MNRGIPALSRARSFWSALLVILMLFSFTAVALAAAPLTGTFVGKVIGRNVTFDHGGGTRTSWAGVLRLDLDPPVSQSVPVFCIQVDVLVVAGDDYISDGPVTALPNGCQIRYLLDRYPASSATTVEEAAARQMAIWAFSDGVDLTTITSTAIRNRAIALRDEANLGVQGGCPATLTEIPDLTLNPPTANGTVGQAMIYTINAAPGGAGLTANITLTGPAQFANGQQQDTVTLDGQGAATFTVTGTAEGNVTVNVSLPYQLDAGLVFSHATGPPTQRLVMGDDLNLATSATATIAIAAPTPIPPTATPTTAPAATATPTPAGAPTVPPATNTPVAVPATNTPVTVPATNTPVTAPATNTPVTAPATPEPAPSNTPVTEPATPAPAPPETPVTEPATPAPTDPASGTPQTGQPTAVAPAGTPEGSGGGGSAGGGQVTGGGAGGASGAGGTTRPRTLPRTSAATVADSWPILLIAALLIGGGWLIRRRVYLRRKLFNR